MMAVNEDIDVIMYNVSEYNVGEYNVGEYNVGDFVKMIKEAYLGYYAVVSDTNYGDECKIQYCDEKYGMGVERKRS